jgi:large subunit ribosomal protein L21
MYAVIAAGGKQYRVEKDQLIDVEKVDLSPGEKINFDQVLMLVNEQECKVGKPFLSGCQVQGEVISTGRREKIRIIKFRRRKHHMKRMGHRQWFTRIKITAIQA